MFFSIFSRFEHREENRKDCLRTLLSLIEEAGKANKLVDDARSSYVKERLHTNPAFMERLHAKSMRLRESNQVPAWGFQIWCMNYWNSPAIIFYCSLVFCMSLILGSSCRKQPPCLEGKASYIWSFLDPTTAGETHAPGYLLVISFVFSAWIMDNFFYLLTDIVC